MRYFIQFSYDGSDYHGSQTQPNAVTVQQVMEQALTTVLRQPIDLVFAGRTDAGVHALQMWAHFDFPLPNSQFSILNSQFSILPSSIAIRQIVPVDSNAHARFSALDRTYQYHIITRKDPFRHRYAARVAAGIDIERMNLAAQYLLGRQDFASFCRVHTDVKTTFCTINEAHWDIAEDGEAVFTITADRFLRNMVRAIVGTLLDIGYGKRSPEELCNIISQHNRCAASQSAPAQGLFLTHISYPNNIFLPPTT
ncbi:MAG: tRNA pseudouridine(38-40) synthase TruA [Bacteroidales bacterium]|nr:tRNA pseudouridine(38-40) synthase TruA [Candidatus Colicola coprequi]